MGQLAGTAAILVDWGIRSEQLGRRAARFGSNALGVHWHDGGAGDPVVLLSGFGASGLVWPHAWVQSLQRDHRVIRVDNRGTGLSLRAPTPFTIADMADDVVVILDKCGISRAAVLGMSMGGMVAQELALRHPERVARLILVSTIPPAPAHVPTYLNAPAIWASLSLGRSDRRSRAEGLARLYLRTGSPRFAPAPAVVAELADQLQARPTPMMNVVQQARAIVAWRNPGRLHGLRVPTTIVVGEADPVVKPLNSDTLAMLIPRTRLVALANIGHMVPWEAPDALSALLMR